MLTTRNTSESKNNNNIQQDHLVNQEQPDTTVDLVQNKLKYDSNKHSK